MSTSKGYHKVPENSLKIGGTAFQIFPHSPSQWKARFPTSEEIIRFKNSMKKAGFTNEEVLVHSGYLINLASPKADVWEKSVKLLKDEIETVASYGLKYLNFHPGSHLGKGLSGGLDRLAKGLDRVLNESESEDIVMLLENVSPKGGNIGSTFEELRKILNLVSYPEKFGITYDTCHGFDAGYDITGKAGMENLMDEIDKTVGLNAVKMIHLNDSKFPLGSAKDRHEQIGKGYIGDQGFACFLSYAYFRNKPLILETPGKDPEHKQDISRIKSILKNKAGCNG
ncbi:MAG: deoxyribonuclease IV [Kosmotoga sp.]|nr:MAG: deoxyribonuclease IV [Kosmotoga sp.]